MDFSGSLWDFEGSLRIFKDLVMDSWWFFLGDS